MDIIEVAGETYILEVTSNATDIIEVTRETSTIEVITTADAVVIEQLAGVEGVPGLPGERWFVDTVDPLPATGRPTDWALNSETGDIFEKTGPITWTPRGNLKGPMGDITPELQALHDDVVTKDTDVNTVAGQVVDNKDLAVAASLEATKQASQSAASAADAQDSASLSQSSADLANQYQTNAAISETNAANSATAASTSATNAVTSETNAASSAGAAATSESNAAALESSVTDSANTASAAATSATTSETNAAIFRDQANTAASQALDSANSSAASDTSAQSARTVAESARDAAVSARDLANTYQTNALTYRDAAASSATDAANSATASGNSATDAANSAAQAAQSATNSDVSAHAALTKNVHGISDSANIVYTATLAAVKVPAGGLTGTVLAKNTDVDNDVKWTAVTKAMVGLGNVDNTSDINKPLSTATTTALAAKADLIGGLIPTSQMPPLAINDTFTPASQAEMLALVAQRGDMAIRSDIGTTFVLATDDPTTLANWKQIAAPNAVTSVAGKTGVIVLNKSDVGLANVDNTSDASKPISTATQSALNLKANLDSPTFTGTVSGITKTMVGLGSVDNTSDINKPISTATQNALNLKSDTTHNHTVESLSNVDHTAASQGNLLIFDTGIWTHRAGTKTDVGLTNVDNTSDINKPVSTATQNALNLKANIDSPSFTGTVNGITKVMVGLSNVDNTSDLAKPISTATQAALNAKAPLASPTFTGTVSGITAAMVGLGNVINVPANVSRVVEASGTYPARPAGATYVEWVGPTDPSAQAGLTVNSGDTWVQSS